MGRFGSIIGLILVGLTLFTPAAQAATPHSAPNFRLLDTSGASHELYYYSAVPAVLLHFVHPSCGQSQIATQLNRLASIAGLPIFSISAGHVVRPSDTALFPERANNSIPLFDEGSLVSRAYGARNQDEWRVVDAARGEIISAERAELAPLLRELEVLSASECELPGASRRKITPSFVGEVAPVLVDRCIACHRENGIAPWPMASYEVVRGFAPMIKEVLATRRMPPWHADPHVGSWRQDQGISTEQRLILTDWIDAGTPRGQGADPLPQAAASANKTWPLGTPDLIITLPPFEVPASGVLEYRNARVLNPLKERRWIKASSIRTNVPPVLHHVLAGAGSDPGEGSGVGDEILFNSFIQAFAPGLESYQTPPDTGIELKPQDTFLFQNHYTPNGAPRTEVTELALYFHDQAPVRPLRHSVVLNKALSIPAHEPQHQDEAYFEFPQSATLYGLLAHAHYRGKSGQFWIRDLQGVERLLLSVPNYDFNWQRTYNFTDPVRVRAGERLIYRAEFDNSVQNFRNPNPNITVKWGEQSFEEMLYGSFLFSWDDETREHKVHDDQWMLIASEVGYRDANRDGSIQRSEMPLGLKLLTFGRFSRFDQNGDLGLDISEIQSVMQWAQSKSWLRWLFFLGI